MKSEHGCVLEASLCPMLRQKGALLAAMTCMGVRFFHFQPAATLLQARSL